MIPTIASPARLIVSAVSAAIVLLLLVLGITWMLLPKAAETSNTAASDGSLTSNSEAETNTRNAVAEKAKELADLQKKLEDKEELVKSQDGRLLASERSREEATGELKDLKEKLQQEQGRTQELEKKVENLELAMRNF